MNSYVLVWHTLTSTKVVAVKLAALKCAQQAWYDFNWKSEINQYSSNYKITSNLI